jgi:hypothetical protein
VEDSATWGGQMELGALVGLAHFTLLRRTNDKRGSTPLIISVREYFFAVKTPIGDSRYVTM